MKTSNKILLSVFLLAILILTAVHVALYAKYKSGDIIAAGTGNDDRFMRQTLDSVKYVSITGLQNFNIITANTARLEIEKVNKRWLRFQQVGDTLTILGDTLVNQRGKDVVRSSGETVNLYIPNNAIIKAANSNVYVAGSKDTTRTYTYTVYLDASEIHPGTVRSWEPGMNILDHLIIQAKNKSLVYLNDNVQVREMSILLNDSRLEERGCRIGKLTLEADSTSYVQLTGINFSKAATAQK